MFKVRYCQCEVGTRHDLLIRHKGELHKLETQYAVEKFDTSTRAWNPANLRLSLGKQRDDIKFTCTAFHDLDIYLHHIVRNARLAGSPVQSTFSAKLVRYVETVVYLGPKKRRGKLPSDGDRESRRSNLSTHQEILSENILHARDSNDSIISAIASHAPQAFYTTLGLPWTKDDYSNWRKQCVEQNLDVDHAKGKVRRA